MKFRSLGDIHQHNNHMQNRVYEVLAVWANEIPLAKQTALKRDLEGKIRETRNFFNADFYDIVKLYNETCCPQLPAGYSLILFVSTQAREMISSFFNLPPEEDENAWIEERIQTASEICTGLHPIMPPVLVYKDLSPYQPYLLRNAEIAKQENDIKLLQDEIDRLRQKLEAVANIQRRYVRFRKNAQTVASQYDNDLEDALQT